MRERLVFKEVRRSIIVIIISLIVLSLITQVVSTYVQGRGASGPWIDMIVDTIILSLGGIPLVYALVKRAAGSIEEANSKFVTLVHQNITGIFIYQDGKYQYVNPRFAEMLGYQKQDFLGGRFTPADIIDKDYIDFANEIIRQKFSGEESPDTYELKYRTKNGDPMWVEVHTTVGTYQGKPSIMGTVIDRTKSKRMETELRESEERYRVLVEMSPDMVAYQQHGVIQYINHAGVELLGAKGADEIVGRHITDFVHEDYKKSVTERLDQLDREVTYAPVLERQFIRLDGRIIDVEGSGSRVIIKGKPVIQLIVRDITKRKQEEQLLRNKEKALTRAQSIAHVGSWETNLLNGSQWSDELYAIFGICPRQRVSFQSFLEFVHPEDREGVETAFRAAQVGDGSIDMDFRVVRPSGEIRHVHSRSETEVDAEGRVERMFGVVHDITDRKMIEEELIRAKEQLQNIFDNVGVVLWSSGLTLDLVTDVSPGVERIYGISREEFMQNPLHWMNYLVPEDRKFLSLANEEVTRGAESLIEYRITHPKTGMIRWIQTRIFPKKNTVGDVVALNGISLDITEKKLVELELIKKEEQYRSLFENHPDAVYSLDTEGKFTDINPASIPIIGYSKDELLGTSFIPFVSTDDLPVATAAFYKTLSGAPQHFEITILNKTGNPMPLKLTTVPIVVNKQIIGSYGFAKDITKEKKAEDFLRGQKRILEMIAKAEPLHHVLKAVIELTEKQLEGALCGISLFDTKTSAFTFAAGPSLPESFIEHVKELKMGTSGVDFRTPLIRANIETDAKWETWRNNALSSGLRACWFIPIHAIDGGILGTFAIYFRAERTPSHEELELINNFSYLAGLVIERRQSEAYIEQLAYYDALTELPNRRLFMERLTAVLDGARNTKQRIAVMFLDLDRFKQINDSLGHAYGDMFLQEVALRLRYSVRDTDLVARMSGDEFVILLPALETKDDAIDIAKRIIMAIREPFMFDDKKFTVTTSIGIAIYPDNAEDDSTLIRNADLAMYTAKSIGKNTYQVFDESMRGKSYDMLVLQSEMTKALDNNEFSVYYQPRIETSMNLVVGAEALIRWQHPSRGMILPGEFIPLAEETGFVVQLGAWVIREACRQNKEWQDAGYPPIRMAVNVSAQQFLENHLGQTIREALQETGLDGKYLEVEITERTMMQYEHTILGCLRELKDMGVHISIDDFGTGYSSLSYLKQFDIDTLKIDRSFVNGIPQNANDMTISDTVITLAHAMNMRVVAEGVETEGQREFLRERQCNELQGFLIGRPVPPNEFAQLNFRVTERM